MIKVTAKIILPRLQLFFIFVLPLAASAQSNVEMRKIFARAESYFLYDEHDLANPLYLMLEKPDNYNIQYKIGTCYLNIPGEKDKAIPYLEAAVKHSSYQAKTASLKEKKAPFDAYFSLAKAYMINNQLEKALSTYQTLKQLAQENEDEGGMKNFPFIEQQIQSCKNAMKSLEAPFRISRRNMGSGFSQGSVNENPAVSFDGNTIVYTERRGSVNAIFYSRKEKGRWLQPVEITETIEAGEDCSSCSLNNDGTILYLYKNDQYDGNIYSSDYINGKWTPIRKLNKNINTKFYESHASVSSDGKKLYFTSNREGGNGGLDIYVSEKDAFGEWGQPVNLGAGINTRFNEDTPFMTKNDSLLYFSSEGHTGMGGYDVFRSERVGTKWKTPENLGSPVNTTDDDKFFQPFNNEKNGFYSMPTQYKEKDIFFITLSNPRLNKVFEITGKYSLPDKSTQFDDSNTISLVDIAGRDTLETLLPEEETGLYNFLVPPGKFRLIYSGRGYYTHIVDTTILASSDDHTINIDVTLEVNPDYLTTGPVTRVYEKIDLSDIPVVAAIDSDKLVRDLRVADITENDDLDTTVLYYTVQVMALYNPVDISYFKYVNDILVYYNEVDLFYRYTTGRFDNKNEAYAHRDDLIRKGYPNDLFIKKVLKASSEKQIGNKIYYTVQLKATKLPLDNRTMFRDYPGVRETKEIDGLYHYLWGRYSTYAEAKTALSGVKEEEFKDAFVREINVLVKK